MKAILVANPMKGWLLMVLTITVMAVGPSLSMWTAMAGHPLASVAVIAATGVYLNRFLEVKAGRSLSLLATALFVLPASGAVLLMGL